MSDITGVCLDETLPNLTGSAGFVTTRQSRHFPCILHRARMEATEAEASPVKPEVFGSHSRRRGAPCRGEWCEFEQCEI